jgi:PAS domain-containing protein
MDAIISMDEGGQIVLYNRAAEATFGWPDGVANAEEAHVTRLAHKRSAPPRRVTGWRLFRRGSPAPDIVR